MLFSPGMSRLFLLPALFCLAIAGCKDPAPKAGPLQIEREYRTIHEEGLGSIRFFEPRRIRDDLWAKCFVVPPTFLGADAGWRGGSPVADPFANPVSGSIGNRKLPDAQEVLEGAGITFGPDHFARYYPADSALVVVLPRDQMELVEAYACSIGPGPERSISVYVEVYEVEAAHHHQLLESWKGEADHTPERDALLQSASLGECSLVESTIVTSVSGARAATEVEEGASRVEIDPVLGADEGFIDLVFRYRQRERQGGEADRKTGMFTVETQLTLIVQQYVSVESWKAPGTDPPRFRHLMIKAEAPPILR